MDDNMLERFNFDEELHQKAIQHAHDKGMKATDLDVFAHIEAWDILSQMINDGKYHTSASVERYIDKRTGKPMKYDVALARDFVDVRKLNVLPFMDRVIYNTFYGILYDRFEYLMHPLCVSYRKGVGTSHVASKLTDSLVQLGMYTGVKGDLSKYFDSVPIELIDQTFDLMEKEEPSAIWKPIRECYHDNRIVINGEMHEEYKSLKQGNPLGCILANIVLRDIDEEMTKYDVVYYRYCDDFIIVGNQYAEAFEKFEEMLEAKGIILNQKKTKYIHDDEWFEFLGFSFKRGLRTVSKETLDGLETEIKTRTMSITRQKHAPASKADIEKMIKNLQSYFFTAFARNNQNFGMGAYLFGGVNVKQDIKEIDCYCKDCLRAAYTNKTNIYGLGCVSDIWTHRITHGHNGKNVAENRRKTQNETFEGGDLLKECGWVSLSKMFNDYVQKKDLFMSQVNMML